MIADTFESHYFESWMGGSRMMHWDTVIESVSGGCAASGWRAACAICARTHFTPREIVNCGSLAHIAPNITIARMVALRLRLVVTRMTSSRWMLVL